MMRKREHSRFSYFAYLAIIFFNSFVDVGHKVIIQNIFYYTADARTYTIMSAIINAMILLPYIFLFTPSGFVSDKFSKVSVLRITAIAAIPLAIFITIFYHFGYFWLAFFMTLLLAVQSTLNSPAKYGYIKERFGKEKLSEVNAYVQTLVIVAILASTFIFSALFDYFVKSHFVSQTALTKAAVLIAIAPIGFLLIFNACGEAILTFFLKKIPAADPDSTFCFKNYIKLRYIQNNVESIYSDQVIFTCIIALSLFWGVNQVILANYGAYLKEYVQGASVFYAQSSLGLGGIGVLLGAIYAGRISKQFIETGIIPVSILGMTLGLFLMPVVTNQVLIIILFLIYGFFGGMLVVPLNALIQFNAPDRKLGKILAGNNFTQNIFMFGFLMITALSAFYHFNSIVMFRLLFFIGVLGTIYAIFRLPQALVRYLTYTVLSRFYSIDAIGIKNIPSSGGVLLLGNHVSYLDWAILQITCPRPIRFVVYRGFYERWYLKLFFKLAHAIPISIAGSKDAITGISNALKAGDVVTLFPEGYISRNGQLGKFHRGFELAIKDTHACIVPFYIRGLWGSMASLSTSLYRKISKKHILRNVNVCYGKSLPATIDAVHLKQEVFKLGLQAWTEYANKLSSIPAEWLTRVKARKGNIVATESHGKEINGYEAIILFVRLRHLLKKKLRKAENHIGIVLPPSIVGAVTNVAILSLNKVIINLNYTTNISSLKHSLNSADLKIVITSRLFINKLALRNIDLSEIFKDLQVIYLEDYQTQLQANFSNALTYLFVKFTPTFLLKKIYVNKINPNRTAVIYFTSGSEGLPKGVELSHRNILINGKQTSSIMNLQYTDIILSCLPLFHAFGLTVTTLMPFLQGIPIVFHPDPADAVGIAKAIAKFRATILCTTSTFLNLYIRHPKVYSLAFQTLRIVISGAEKLSLGVAEQFNHKFNINILEGYGATETSPVISSNLPDILITEYWHVQQGYKLGTVGLPVPGTTIQIVHPKTFKVLPHGESGMVIVTGPQIMKGYLNDPKKTEQVLIKKDNLLWYVTGDQGFLDEDGYLTITDRYARFAKIGGEMISLTALEELIQPLLTAEKECVAVNLPDPKKGEKIYLLTTDAQMNQPALKAAMLKVEINPLMIPDDVFYVDEIPKLGSGKINFAAARKIAEVRDE